MSVKVWKHSGFKCAVFDFHFGWRATQAHRYGAGFVLFSSSWGLDSRLSPGFESLSTWKTEWQRPTTKKRTNVTHITDGVA